jgi:NAD(P)-dependent dehydrogenase (short-subunit alcohol dehydrogenase family)
MEKKVLITGASGLLGQALVEKFLKNGFHVLAQYHRNKPSISGHCSWLWADFSDVQGIRDFLDQNREELKSCDYLINNYGPITYKEVSQLESRDFIYDYHHNVITAFEITRFMLGESQLRSVVNIGFEDTGQMKAYKKIVTYAAAKNALLLMTRSLEQRYPEVGFHIVSLPTLEGAAVGSRIRKPIAPSAAAEGIYKLIAN